MPKTDAEIVADAHFRASQAIGRFIADDVAPLVRSAVNRSDPLQDSCAAYLDRVDCWLRSVGKLNQPSDFQAIDAAARSLFEIVVDLTLLLHDRTCPVQKMVDWEQWARFKRDKNTIEVLGGTTDTHELARLAIADKPDFVLGKQKFKAELIAIRSDRDATDERKLLEQYLALADTEGALWSQANAAQLALTEKVAEKYGKLSEDEVKALVIDDKWLVAVHGAVRSELDRVSQTLTGRMREIAERYATPLPDITSELETLAARVQAHLTQMGFAP